MEGKQVLLFGGKGGVGKTTCSAAVASWYASRGRKTMVVTSDMTPSLSDIFETPIGDRITEIAPGLSAFEISQDAIAGRWKAKFSKDFSDILAQLVDLDGLDRESRHQLLDYIGSAPSLREETMLDLIVDLIETGGYDRVVWDTAPSGETLNLLQMPRFIRKHLTAGAKVFQGLDKIGKQLVGRRSIAATMDEWIVLSDRIAGFVRRHSEFVVVAKPEALVVKHVERLLTMLGEYSLSLRGMVINCMIDDSMPGMPAAMKGSQAVHSCELRRLAGNLAIAVLPLSAGEIRGLEALRKAGASLCAQLGMD